MEQLHIFVQVLSFPDFSGFKTVGVVGFFLIFYNERGIHTHV